MASGATDDATNTASGRTLDVEVGASLQAYPIGDVIAGGAGDGATNLR